MLAFELQHKGFMPRALMAMRADVSCARYSDLERVRENILELDNGNISRVGYNDY
jgi:hypothetical protein